MNIDETLMDLLKEMSLIHGHLDNDLYRDQDMWRERRDECAREIADYYNSNIYDGPYEATYD